MAAGDRRTAVAGVSSQQSVAVASNKGGRWSEDTDGWQRRQPTIKGRWCPAVVTNDSAVSWRQATGRWWQSCWLAVGSGFGRLEVVATRERNKIKIKKKIGLFLEIVSRNKKLLFFFCFLFLFQVYSLITFIFWGIEK